MHPLNVKILTVGDDYMPLSSFSSLLFFSLFFYSLYFLPKGQKGKEWQGGMLLELGCWFWEEMVPKRVAGFGSVPVSSGR